MSKSKQQSRRRLTEADYERVKKVLDKGAAISATRQATGLGASTLRRIKRSKNYKSYLAISRRDSTNAEQRKLMAQGYTAKEARDMLTIKQPQPGAHEGQPNNIITDAMSLQETDENGKSVPVEPVPSVVDEQKAEDEFERDWRKSNADPTISLEKTAPYFVSNDMPPLEGNDKMTKSEIIVLIIVGLVGVGLIGLMAWGVGALFQMIF